MPLARPKPTAPTANPSDQPPTGPRPNRKANGKANRKSGGNSADSAKTPNPPPADRGESRPHAKPPTSPLDGLTPKQATFVRAYVGEAHGNGSEAARRAGYAVPKEQAYENLTKPHVKLAIGTLASESLMDAEECLTTLAFQARARMGHYAGLVGLTESEDIQAQLGELMVVGLDRAIRKLTPTKYGLSVELHDSQAALTTIGKHLRLWTDRVEHSQGPPAIDAEAVRRALSDPRALELACELDRIISRPSPETALGAPPRASEPSDVDSYHPTPTDAATGLVGPSNPPDATTTVDGGPSGTPGHPPASAAVGGVGMAVGRPAPGAECGLEGEPFPEGSGDGSPDMAPISVGELGSSSRGAGENCVRGVGSAGENCGHTGEEHLSEVGHDGEGVDRGGAGDDA